MLRHCSMSPASQVLFDGYAAAGKSIILVMGHQGNWEWAGNTFSLVAQSQLYVIYHPLSNPYMNGLVYKMRTRFNTKLIAMKDTFKEMVSHRKEVTVTAFIADQTPHPDHAYWTTFPEPGHPGVPGHRTHSRQAEIPYCICPRQESKEGLLRNSCRNPGRRSCRHC